MATALAGCVATAAALSNVSKAAPVSPFGGPDAELIELCRQCAEALERHEAIFARYSTKGLDFEAAREIDDQCGEESSALYHAEVVPLLDQIAEIEPATLDGFAAKAFIVVKDHVLEFIGNNSALDNVTSLLLKELAGRGAILVGAQGPVAVGQEALKLDPDHELVAAYEKWIVAVEKYEAMWPLEEEYGWDLDKSPSAKFYDETVSPLAKFLETMSPTTPAGVAAKAKFIKRAYDGSDLEPVRPFFDELIGLPNAAQSAGA